MSNRRITNEQFSVAGAIDGSRIQTALDDTEEFINSVPISAIKERYSLNNLVFTFLGTGNWFTGAPAPPKKIGACRHSPFLYHEEPLDGGKTRVKGTLREGHYPGNYTDSVCTPHVFTAATMFHGPVILDSLGLWINGVGVFGADLLGAFHGLPLRTGSDSNQRVRIIVDTDDVVHAEDRALNSKEYVLKDFQEQFFSGKYKTSASTMLPLSARNTTEWGSQVGGSVLPQSQVADSLFLNKTNINLPLHQASRVRFRIVLYSSALDANAIAMRTPENMTFTVTYKEALKSG